jgi:hypothetical protein
MKIFVVYNCWFSYTCLFPFVVKDSIALDSFRVYRGSDLCVDGRSTAFGFSLFTTLFARSWPPGPKLGFIVMVGTSPENQHP